MAHDLKQLFDLLAWSSGKPDAWVWRKANSFLASSENHAPKVPPFREPPCGIGMNTRKTIAVQCSLTSATQA